MRASSRFIFRAAWFAAILPIAVLTGCSKDPAPEAKPAASVPAAAAPVAPSATSSAVSAAAKTAPATAALSAEAVANNPLYSSPAKAVFADKPAAEDIIIGSVK